MRVEEVQGGVFMRKAREVLCESAEEDATNRVGVQGLPSWMTTLNDERTVEMFSVAQKRAIADAVQRLLRETNHPELPDGEITFSLHVEGAESWSWADIRNNGAVPRPDVNWFNELQAAKKVV